MTTVLVVSVSEIVHVSQRIAHHVSCVARSGCGAWGFSSAGRAPALQAGGQRFESVILHGFEIIDMLGTRNDFFCQKQFTLRTPVVVSRVENRAKNLGL